jgi:mannose-6-phosphate isomerase
MIHISILENIIQEYAWGSHTAIADLLGAERPSEKPQAELWMGAHNKAPSMVRSGEKPLPLNELIETCPDQVLGKTVAKKFANQLPYLFKVLAAEKPLSIQAHPDLAQARKGFRRENDRGIALDAPNRNYRDANHKPECICAMTPFWALCGFREISQTLSLLTRIETAGLSGMVKALSKQPDGQGLKRFFTRLLTLSGRNRKSVIQDAVLKAGPLRKEDPAFDWMLKLHAQYADDVGIFSPILLNLVCLEPGQALFLPAGELHAYLEGVGMELMANSDNVLRGGLTPKHIDVEELCRILNFKEKKLEILTPAAAGECERVYPSQAEEFVLSAIVLAQGQRHASRGDRGVEIMLCTQGAVTITEKAGGGPVSLPQGGSVLIPASVGGYQIEGEGTLYKAAVPV